MIQNRSSDRSVLIGQKLVENAKNSKIQMRHFESFLDNELRTTVVNLLSSF